MDTIHISKIKLNWTCPECGNETWTYVTESIECGESMCSECGDEMEIESQATIIK